MIAVSHPPPYFANSTGYFGYRAKYLGTLTLWHLDASLNSQPQLPRPEVGVNYEVTIHVVGDPGFPRGALGFPA